MMLFLKVFHDIGDERIVSQESIMRGRFLGKGAFGAVYAGTMIDKVFTALFTVLNLTAVLVKDILNVVMSARNYAGDSETFTVRIWT